MFIVNLEHSEFLARLGTNFIYIRSRQDRQNCDLSSFSRLSLSSGRFLSSFTRIKQHIEQRKKENSIGLIARLPIGDR